MSGQAPFRFLIAYIYGLDRRCLALRDYSRLSNLFSPVVARVVVVPYLRVCIKITADNGWFLHRDDLRMKCYGLSFAIWWGTLTDFKLGKGE